MTSIYTNMHRENIVLYTLPNCKNCEKIKIILKQKGIKFKEYTLNAESLADLRYDGIFSLTAPIVKIKNTYYTDIEKILEVIYKL